MTKIFTDGERSILWGIEQTEIETLKEKTIPYCYNPETQRAVLVFDGRRRASSVLKIFNTATTPIDPKPIRSKKSILPFLANGEIEDVPTFFNQLEYGFGLDWRRISGEYSKQVEIARIINEFNFDSLKDLNAYLLKERPDLYPELVSHHNYYTKIIKNFKTTDRLKEIDTTISNGFNQIAKAIQSNI
ncbi:hypothetical protein HCA93_03290 [Listeria innocua]|uniref:hypothetical protein n=1 Tax=Listeria innocua TaxID=1642 RepID=UPI00162A6633|nr:hypothetical protein [Listeria innocua]MBC2135333.1 hypothetical protein [Listeria innocua]